MKEGACPPCSNGAHALCVGIITEVAAPGEKDGVQMKVCACPC